MTKGPQQIDWAGIRAAAVVMGVRAAARKAASNLPEYQQKRFLNRVMQRCHREGWIKAKEEDERSMSSPADNPADIVSQVVETPATRCAKPLSAPVSTGQQVLSGETLSKHEKRAFLARIVRTPIGDVSAASDLCQEHTVTEGMTKVKMPSKLQAIELDAKLAGELGQEQDRETIAIQINVG